MAKYTCYLHELLSVNFDIGLKDYPIFDEKYRIGLNKKIVEHFRFYEIGAETPELFKYYLNRTMNEIMPYYNQLYKSTLIDFNPLSNTDMWTTTDLTELYNTLINNNGDTSNLNLNTGENISDDNTVNTNKAESSTDATNNYEETSNGTTSGSNQTKTTNKNEHRHSDTPQGMLSKGFMSDDTWISDASQDDSSNTSNTETTGNNEDNKNGSGSNNSHSVDESNGSTKFDGNTKTDVASDNYSTFDNTTTNDSNRENNTVTHASGYSGVNPSELLKSWRETFLNIDMMVIDELKSCFMMIY